MRENNCEDVSDLEIQAKTWNKLKNNMKLIGFREGAAKGRDQSLQEGFDIGYTAGFELGEHIGQTEGILSCPVELTSVKGSKLTKKNLRVAPDEVCMMCSKGKNDAGENRNESYPNMDEIVFQQQKLSSEIIKDLKNSNLFLDKM